MYVILLIRPSSCKIYRRMQDFCFQRHIDIAADVIDADYKFPHQPDTFQPPASSPPR